MALVRVSPVVVHARGRFAGCIFSRDNGGNNYRVHTKRVKKCTASQREVRIGFAKAVQRWNVVARTPALVQLWEDFADYPETAYQAFIRISWHYLRNGLRAPGFPPS